MLDTYTYPRAILVSPSLCWLPASRSKQKHACVQYDIGLPCSSFFLLVFSSSYDHDIRKCGRLVWTHAKSWRCELTFKYISLNTDFENCTWAIPHTRNGSSMHARTWYHTSIISNMHFWSDTAPLARKYICLHTFLRHYNLLPSKIYQHQSWRRKRTVLYHVVTWDPFNSWIFVTFRHFIASQAHQAYYAFQAYHPNRFESSYVMWASACRYALCTIGTTSQTIFLHTVSLPKRHGYTVRGNSWKHNFKCG